MRHRSINRNSAVASGSSFFNGWRSTPGTTPLTSQLILLISTTTTKVEIGSNAARLRLRSLTCSTGQPPSVRMDDEGATTSAAPPHSFSHLGYVTAKRFSLRLAVCAPAPVTHLPGSESGACFAGSHSPWPLPFAPPAPRRSRPLCSSASQLLWQSLTSRDRASSATAPRLPDADRRQLPNGRSRDLPVPAQGASAHARFFDHAGSFGPCDDASETCCLPRSKRRRHPGIGFRGSMAGLCPPLPTLRRRPRGRQRTARGRCRSLLLHRSGLAPPTPCRSPGALRVLPPQPGSLHELTCELGSRGGAQPNLRPARSEGAGFVTLNSSPVIAAGLLLRSSTGLGHDHSEPDPARPRPSGDLDGARWTKGLSS